MFVLLMSPNTSLTPRQMIRAIVAVAVGGATGTLVRDGLVTHLDPGHKALTGWTAYAPLQSTIVSWVSLVPWALLCINVIGVFLVTLLLRTGLRGHDPNDVTRLLIVTGFFGGFTSYSGLFVDLAAIWHQSALGGLLVGICAVASGVVAAQLGLWTARQR